MLSDICSKQARMRCVRNPTQPSVNPPSLRSRFAARFAWSDVREACTCTRVRDGEGDGTLLPESRLRRPHHDDRVPVMARRAEVVGLKLGL